MKYFKCLWIVSLISAISCTSIISENDTIDQIENLRPELESFLSQIALAPVDKPVKVSEYQLDRFLYDIHKYYDSDGNELIDIYTDISAKDTSHITTYEYKEGLPSRKTKYLVGSNLEKHEVFLYNYSSSQKLHQVTKNGQNFELYKYNDQGQVESIILGGSQILADMYQFSYDLDGRIITQILKSVNGGDTPLRYWSYVYNNEGKLLAKQVPEKPTNEFKDMFVYTYDIHNRLIEISEFYPEYNFSLWKKTIFTYASKK